MLCLNFSGYAQSIALKMNKVTVEEAITELQKKSGYSFVYMGGDLDLDKTVSIDAKELQEAIDQILKGQGVTYEIQGKNIVVRKGAKKAQQPAKKVTGAVKDAAGAPIIGASVRLLGTDKGTITDIDGNFSLDMSKGDEVEISYIGYTTQESSQAIEDFGPYASPCSGMEAIKITFHLLGCGSLAGSRDSGNDTVFVLETGGIAFP